MCGSKKIIVKDEPKAKYLKILKISLIPIFVASGIPWAMDMDYIPVMDLGSIWPQTTSHA